MKHMLFPASTFSSYSTATSWLLALSILCAMVLVGPAGPAFGETRSANARLRIVIVKDTQLLEVYENGRRVKTYKVCLGITPAGPKLEVGDKRTPEGEYFICSKSTVSKYHKFMGISYPGAHDAQRAFENGRISLDTRDSILKKVTRRRTPPWNTKLGGWVGIHGYPSDEYIRRWLAILFPKPTNWTDGCVAMWNFEMDELFSMVPIGAPVTILPRKGTGRAVTPGDISRIMRNSPW